MNTIIFDFDDTLVADQNAAGRAFIQTTQTAADHYGVNVVRLAEVAREEARRLWRTFTPVRPFCLDIGISSWVGLWANFEGNDPHYCWLREHRSEYRRKPWEFALRNEGINDAGFAGELGQLFTENRGAIVEIYPDVIEGLKRLRNTFRLALLTNGESDLQLRKISASGLTDFFEVIVISGDFGTGKPAPSIFQTTLDQLDSSASETQMVGDSIECDVGGAQAVGIEGVWINRDQVANTTEIQPDHTILSLADL